MNISPSFLPPITLMKPYFLLAGIFYLLSIVSLFFLNPFSALEDFSLIGWVHLYMLGFVMMGIFAAMAQLGPIVVEARHYNVKIFKYLWILLTLGISLMMMGFYLNPTFLLYGGAMVLLTMSIYAGEFLLTLKNAKRNTSITKAMKMSNFFLLLGILSGLVMALAFNGLLELNPHGILKMHTFGLVVGFVILLIMGISIILIPMFGSATRISDNEFTNSFYAVSLGVAIMIASVFALTQALEYLSYFITTVAILLYLYQLYKMTSSRKKITHDIWTRSMYVAFSSFIIAFCILIFYLLNQNELYLRVGMWLMFVGFFGFIITGNFYKVIPFLVWFHIYSPLIEERAVPMLHELVPKHLSILQWFYASVGLIISTIGLYKENQHIFTGGIVLLTIAAFIFLSIINQILNSK
jgi:uncharacterized membrane protein